MYDEPSVSPLSSSDPLKTKSSLLFLPKLNMALCTWPVWPRRTPAEPRGWNQWVTMPAPLSRAHIVTALATRSAILGFSCHVVESRVSPGRPTFDR